MTPVAYILVGVPSAGKTTWTGHQKYDWGRTVIASTDNYIEQIARTQGKTYSEVFQEHMPDAVDYMVNAVKWAIEKDYDIIWDQTSTTIHTRAKKLRMLPEHYKKVAVVFKTPPAHILKKRLDSRPGKTIPQEVIDNFIKQLEEEPPTLEEGFDEIWFAVGQGLDYEV